jgi:predicted DNA binding CopG/RHH family protein
MANDEKAWFTRLKLYAKTLQTGFKNLRNKLAKKDVDIAVETAAQQTYIDSMEKVSLILHKVAFNYLKKLREPSLRRFKH